MADRDPAVSVARLADELEAAYARAERRPSPPSAREGGLSLETAYQVEAELVSRRKRAGRRTLGLKVGFASKAAWRVLKLDTLVWAHLYDDTVHRVGSDRPVYSGSARVAPRLEPEIVLCLARPLVSGMTDPTAVLDHVDWLALGIEINDCVFPDWKFQPADFVAAYGFHTALFVGEPRKPRAGDVDALATFGLRLSRDGVVVEEGSGRNALKSPALCLAELVSALARQTAVPAEALRAGDLVSTGTLTTPQPIAAGETWRVEADSLDLAPLTLDVA
jgi:2-keto-4-pentenoate hydratase